MKKHIIAFALIFSLLALGSGYSGGGGSSLATPVSVANGGTASAAALNNNRVMRSSGSAIVEAAAITASRALISDANGIPTHSTVTSTQLADLLVGHLAGFVESPTAKTYILDQYAEFAYTINRITTDLASGTVTGALQINGVDVTSCTGISLTSSEVQTTCTAANTVAVGDTVSMVLSSASSPVDLAFTVKYTRN